MKYLIVKCTELNDQYECDCDRKPIKLVDNYEKYYHKYGYEIYECFPNGNLKLIQSYDNYYNDWNN